MEDITTKLTEGRYFSVLDARPGCWAMNLSKDSSVLMRFNSGVAAIVNEALVFGRRTQDHETHLREREGCETEP